MPTATQSNFAATSSWQDITAAIAAAANSDVLLQNVGAQPARVFFGGGAAPGSDASGVLLVPGGTVNGNAANIWVRGNGPVSVTSGFAQTVGGLVPAGAADAGNPVKVGGVYSLTPPTLTDGQRGNMQLTNRGGLIVQISDGTTWIASQAPSDGVSSFASLRTFAYQAISNGASYDMVKKPSATSRLLSAAATTNATSVKASKGDLFRLRGFNASASARYLKLYNKASAPTVGTDTPVATYYLAPSAPFDIDFQTPLYFSTGLAYALTGAAPDSDTTALTAGDIVCLNIHYA